MVFLLFSCLLSISVAQAQLLIPGTNLTVITVNGGTGSLVSIPIPGGSGLSISVGQGSAALPLQNINNMTDSTSTQLGDDGWKDVPLPFQFPYWGQTFNQSTMYSNGVVQFGRPVGAGWPNWNNSFCCHGSDLTTNTNTGYNYSIMSLWTDLVDFDGNTTYYRGTTDSMTYGWYNQSQYGQINNRNTFELKINNTGAFDVRYGGTFVSSIHGVTIGMTGDLSQGQYVQLYNGMGFTGPTTGFSWEAPSGTNAVDQCIINPLSSPSCSGYQTAYFNQQCSLNTLYNVGCPGYASAYLTHQCSVNPLYSTTCNGYEQAYLNSRCIIDSLYSNRCEGYATAYAIKYLVPNIDSTAVNASLSNTAATRVNDPVNTIVATNTASTTISNDGTVSTGVSITGDTNVDRAITVRASTANVAIAPGAVQLIPPPPPPQQQMVQNEPRGDNKQEDKKDDTSKGSGGSSSSQNSNNSQASPDRPAAPTTRQAIQERREAAALASAVERGKDLSNEMGKASDLEAQKAVQNIVIQAMGFTSGFDAYSTQLITQQQFYKPYQVYGNQKTVDNRANLRMFGGTDRLHNEMVEQQYESR